MHRGHRLGSHTDLDGDLELLSGDEFLKFLTYYLVYPSASLGEGL